MLHRPGAIVAGKYRLEKPLARGGVGTVWVAHHVELGHPVAVKFLDPRVAQSPQVRTRFEREARAAAHLRTPHIVQVFDYGVQTDTPYLVMELLQGETLHARLRKVKQLSLVEAYRILVQIGKGLKRAHDVGFVHRDLKPANIYLARGHDDEEEVVKILDFGIAKEMNAEIGESTKTGELVGSPHFMSPEQIRGEREVDARSDLWALGVILFKAVTGELPFPGEVLTAVITKIVIDPIPSVRTYLPGAPAALDAFFTKALSRDRAQRFQSVRDLVVAFGEVAAIEAGVQNAQALSPIAMTGTYRAAQGSGVDLLGNSLFPSSFPGASTPGAPLSGSLPGTPLPGSLPGTPLPGSMPGSMTDALRPPPVPSISAMPESGPSSLTPVSGMAPEPRLPLPSVPSSIGTPSVPPASSPPTLTAAGTAMPPASPDTGRKSRWGLAAGLGAVALLAIGLTLGAMRLRTGGAEGTSASAGDTGAAHANGAPHTTGAPHATEDPGAPSATAPAQPAGSADPDASDEPELVVELVPSGDPAASAAPSSSASAPAAKVRVPSVSTGAKGAPASTGAKARPGGKKPVDTID